MIASQDTVITETAKPACDGDKASPHPRVFLAIGPEGSVDCPYCGRHFVLKEGAEHSHA